MAQEYVYWNRDHIDQSYIDQSYTDKDYTHHGDGNGHADHAYWPAMVDPQERKKPVVLFNPGGNTEAYVTTETVVERFVPTVTEYRYNYPIRREAKDKILSPEKLEHSPPKKAADEHKYGYPLRVEYVLIPPGKVEERKNRLPRLEYYQRSSPVRLEEYRHSSPAKEPVHDRPPPEVEQIITKIQTEVTRGPVRRGPLTALNWRQPRDGNKPNSNGMVKSDSFDDGNGWGGRKHAEWAAAPNSNLTRPTSDIGEAVDALKDAVAPSSGQHVRFPAQTSTRHKYTGTIDSKKAEEKYKGASLTDRKV